MPSGAVWAAARTAGITTEAGWVRDDVWTSSSSMSWPPIPLISAASLAVAPKPAPTTVHTPLPDNGNARKADCTAGSTLARSRTASVSASTTLVALRTDSGTVSGAMPATNAARVPGAASIVPAKSIPLSSTIDNRCVFGKQSTANQISVIPGGLRPEQAEGYPWHQRCTTPLWSAPESWGWPWRGNWCPVTPIAPVVVLDGRSRLRGAPDRTQFGCRARWHLLPAGLAESQLVRRGRPADVPVLRGERHQARTVREAHRGRFRRRASRAGRVGAAPGGQRCSGAAGTSDRRRSPTSSRPPSA